MLPEEIALTAVFSVLVMINLVSNSVVCWVVIKHQQMRTSMNYLLLNLAVSDIMVALFIAPQYVFRYTFTHPGGNAGNLLCKLVTGGNFIWTGGAASAFTLVVIAVERYYAIVHPHLGRHNITPRRLIFIIIGSWIYAIAFNLPIFFVIGYKKKGNDFRCPEVWPTETFGKLYTVGAFFVFGAIPIGIMAIFYPLTIRALWKNRVEATEASYLAITRDRKKATHMVLVVSVLYSVCWLPNLILYMLSQFRPDFYEYSDVPYRVSVLLVCLNSTMNPFVYSFHSTRFRDKLKNVVCCTRFEHRRVLYESL